MSDDSSARVASRHPWRTLGALAFLLVFAALVIVWALQAPRVTAVALFEIDPEKTSVVSDSKPSDGDFTIFRKTQIALLKSRLVLQSALSDPAIAKRSVLAAEPDPISWLNNHLEASYPQDSAILEIKLSGPRAQGDDLVAIVNAVAGAYKKEVIDSQRVRQLSERDLLARSLEQLTGELKRKSEDYVDLAKATGKSTAGDRDIETELAMKRIERIDDELAQLERDQLKIESGGEGSKDSKYTKLRIDQLSKRQTELVKNIQTRVTRSVELDSARNDLKQLQKMADEMSVRLERADIEIGAPLRIRQLQPATIEPPQVAER